MEITVILKLSEDLFERARQYAAIQQQEISDAIAEFLDETLPTGNGDKGYIDWTDHDEAVDREMHAYIAMHPELKKKYLGKHVAIYNGQLIDHDDDFDALYRRIDQKYPDEFVWMTTVESEAMPTLTFRSPRIDRNP